MRLKRLIKKFRRVWKEDGGVTAFARVLHFVGNVEGRKVRKQDIRNARKNHGKVLFINGCCVEHPTRYRVFHQMEQLEMAGIACAKVYFEDIELQMEQNYEFFIFYRCECTEDVEAFIKLAKSHGKKVCFDVDDLVTDTIYTDQVPFVQELSTENKKIFDTSVRLMGKTLSLCDMAVTTTAALAKELGRSVPITYINRNTASKEMVECAETAYHQREKDQKRIWLGYFSGSLTHNKDFEIVRPVLVRILKNYPHAGILLVGELDASDELNQFSERVRKLKTTDWRELPELIARADINLAPLEDTLFNRAKSELKWFEAALVRVPTAASSIGAFSEMIKDGETGVLCGNTEKEWYEKLAELIENGAMREKIAQNSYQFVKQHCTTEGTCFAYSRFISSNL